MRERAFALIGALLFIGTTVGATVAILWQIRQDDTTSQTITTDQTEEAPVYGPLSDFTPVDKVESLQKIDTIEGSGDEVKSSDTVTVKYTGAYASDGQIFDSSDLHGGEPISFPLDGVIPGWTEGMPGMKVGGKRRLLIPANLAYEAPGVSRPPGFRENADLVFDIDLIKIGE